MKVKVFISWSGDAGQRLGSRLTEWLPSIVPEAEPFLSSEIPGGAAWFSSLAAALEGAKFGIICLTPEAQKSPWLAFEAGALWRQTGGTGVVPILAGLATSDIVGPFAPTAGKTVRVPTCPLCPRPISHRRLGSSCPGAFN